MRGRSVTASPEELLRQGSMSAHEHFHAAIKSIDNKFGDGYSAKHPELIGAFINAAALNCHSSSSQQAIQDATDVIADAIRSLKDQ
jgi:hypothetical protein